MATLLDAIIRELRQESREIGETISKIFMWAAKNEPEWVSQVRQSFANAPAQIFQFAPTWAKDIICGYNYILNQQDKLCQFYYPSNPVTMFILQTIRWWVDSNRAQFDNDPANQKMIYRTMGPSAAAKEAPTQRFPGFKERRHICLIGSTDSGKTTNCVSMLLKNNMFAFFDIFTLCASGLDGENMNNFRKATMWNLNMRRKPTQNSFAYFKNEEVDLCIDFVSDPEKRNKQKLVFFDDQQAMSSSNIKSVGNFVMQAKNTNATLIISLHQGYAQGNEKKIRDACQYMIIFNQNEDTFNRLLGLKVGNSLWKKYALISDKYKRVVIYDMTERTLWYGLGSYERFDPVQPII